MSLQADFNHSPAPTHSCVNSDSLFQELDHSFTNLWNSELTSYVQSVQGSVLPQAATQPTRSRRNRKQRVLSSPSQQASETQATPVSPIRPARTRRIARRKVSKQPLISLKTLRSISAPSAAWVKAAGVAAGVFGLSVGSYQWYQNFQQSRELPPIRQVMYQNAQTKVAAFRKEIEDGEHFISDANSPIEYIVQTGDTVEKISKKFHVTPNTILKNNNPSKIDDVLEPGTKLTILPVDGIAHPVEKNETIAELSKRYAVGVQDIVDANELDNPHMITEKQKIIIPNATELKRRPEPKPVLAAIRNSHTGQSAPLVKTQTGRRLSWPAAGTVTSNYGWRWFRMHNGMDIAGPVGTPVKAAKEGRIAYSGWMGGYGYCIDIDHGNGVITRYGHNSALHAQVGQYVYRGQTIAAMGSTGHSTGPHLHFEVHVNGSAIDPRGYF